jgi:phosphoglycolate phosphatase-like HAD superfamily hydrolase
MQPIGVVGEPFRGSVRLRRIPDFEEEYVAALESWRDGSARGAILEFVRSVTEPGPGFVPEVERIATFDNDGTLWCEKPMYVQADFVLRKWRAMAASDPSLAERQPYKALVEGDRAWLSSLTDHVPDLVRGISEAFAGLTTEAFEAEVLDFFRDARHPTLDVPYTEVAYAPMRELLALLDANGFRVFICSAGGRDFVRAVCEQVYAIPRDRVIGSSAPVELHDGQLLRVAGVEQPIDDGAGKPVHIWARTGRTALLAGGNADGDVEMLSSARFALLVHHDDPEREFAYDAGAERALNEAATRGWTVASMKADFSTVFDPTEKSQVSAL